MTMDCRNFNRNLEDYLDGGLDFAGRFDMERHAEQCFACGKEMAGARKLRMLTVSLARVKAPADFEARVRDEIALRKSQGVFTRVRNYLTFSFEWRRPAFAAAVCAALVFVFFSAQYFRLNEPVPATAENLSSTAEEEDFAEAPENFKMETLDILLVSPDNHYTPEQLPRKIRVRYGPPSEEYFIRNVSH
jgi:anti-sigma factor RsiW